MSKQAAFLCLTLTMLIAIPAIARADGPRQITVLFRGAHCDRCVSALRASLRKVDAIKFDAAEIMRGNRPNYHSDPFIVTIADPSQLSIGALGQTVAETNTPHKDDLPPSLNLVLWTGQSINEESVSALRSALTNVTGVEVQAPGGLGGSPRDGYYWIRLEAAGGGDLDDIIQAAKEAVDHVSLTKN